ncbi:MAG TPA: hypothetical protein VLA43_13355 [Longimicrobiales bacterium]|nr:hypothetical protein [Longimicrobiales bacterium]
MTHLDEGQLLAVRDDESLDEHLAGCALCREGLDALRSRREVVSGALAALDTPTDLAAARARIRQRVSDQAARAPGVTPLRPRKALWSLSRAAGLLLVTAAGLSALPGSPVRGWLAQVLAPDAPAARTEAVTAPASEATPAEAEATGVRLAVARGPLRVVVVGAEAGSEIRVRWVPGSDAAVFAPVGSRFTSGDGRLEARVTSGTVRVELPRGVFPVSLEVGGRIYLRSTDAGLDVSGPVTEQSASEIVFRIP